MTSDERKGKEKKTGRRREEGKLNRQTIVTIATGKLYCNCQNCVSSVSFSRRDEGRVDVLTQDIKMYHAY